MANPVTPVTPYYSPLQATSLGRKRYAVRPEGRLGTCGFHPAPWTVVYVTARSAVHACALARDKVWG
jgi:hypothetical protein